jgi:hypothetical protein
LPFSLNPQIARRTFAYGLTDKIALGERLSIFIGLRPPNLWSVLFTLSGTGFAF